MRSARPQRLSLISFHSSIHQTTAGASKYGEVISVNYRATWDGRGERSCSDYLKPTGWLLIFSGDSIAGHCVSWGDAARR